ncbi:hypothetical protein [Streptomyces sp. NBC_00019]|uniref:hypothetical protein n=1 Tax=Streptomyces sp. NBC_00019 TaxID=2975623 RepID=UPI003256528A
MRRRSPVDDVQRASSPNPADTTMFAVSAGAFACPSALATEPVASSATPGAKPKMLPRSVSYC